MGVIIADSDADGLLSALILQKNTGFSVKFAEERNEDYLRKIVPQERVIFADLTPPPSLLKTLKDYVIYDHHRTPRYSSAHFNPLFEGINPAPSCSVYLYKKLGFEGPPWFQNLLILSDFIPTANMKYLGVKKAVEEILGWIWIYARLDLSYYFPSHSPHIYSVLLRSVEQGDPLGIVEDREITKLHVNLVEEITRVTQELGEAEVGERVVGEIESGLRLRRKAARLLWDKHPGKTVVVGQIKGKKVEFSVRSRVERADVLARKAGEFGGRGGGHPEAAGGWVPRERWEEFKAWLLGRKGSK